MAKETTPNRLALCVMLAKGNHMDGVLLERIVHWRQYGNAVIPNVEGKWIANDRRWWMQEARLSADQYDRAIARLKKRGLIEAKQWWWGKRNILNVRPSSKTLDYIAAAKTWQAAYEFIGGDDQIEKLSSSAELGSAILLNSNGISKSAEPTSAGLLNSNNMGNVHAYFVSEEQQHSCAPPAAPSCAVSGLAQEGNGYGGEKTSIPVSSTSAASSGTKASSVGGLEPPTIKHLVSIWRAAMLKYYGKAVAQKLTRCDPTPKETGMIAEFLAGMANWGLDPKTSEDWRPFTPHILAFGVSRWSTFEGTYGKLVGYPSFAKFYEDGAAQSYVIASWVKHNYPAHDLGDFLEP